MRASIAETLKWIRENYFVANSIENLDLRAEIRHTRNSSYRIVVENFDENFNTWNKLRNRRLKRRYKAVISLEIDLLEDFISFI